MSLLHSLLRASCLLLAGCSDTVQLGVNAVQGKKSGHELFGWKAEDYFTDAKVIALCRAIEVDDLKEIDRLVANGADVNAKGKGNMTPLLWSYLDDKIDRFQRLLVACRQRAGTQGLRNGLGSLLLATPASVFQLGVALVAHFLLAPGQLGGGNHARRGGVA